MKYINEEKSIVLVNGVYVPRGHRLWAELGIQDAEDADTIELYVEPDLTAQNEHHWVESELSHADVQINLHLDVDTRATATEAEWRTYRKALRDYTTVTDGVYTINTAKPIRPV